MVLIDTSCWIHALRKKGNPDIAARVRNLLDQEEAAWCDKVRLELWHGVANDWDRQILEFLEEKVNKLPITSDVWQHSAYLAGAARSKGLNVPVTDILILACARIHGVRVDRADKHFDLLEQMFPV